MKNFLTIIAIMATMVAAGQTNTAKVNQTNGNSAIVKQKNGAKITATQNNTGGEFNTIVATQVGQNTAIVKQEGAAQEVIINQNGDDNLITEIRQGGANNTANVKQKGNRNDFGVRGYASDYNSQGNIGNNNTLTAKQIGSDNKIINMDQSGSDNTANFTQKGNFNKTEADQSGNTNNLTIKQTSTEAAGLFYRNNIKAIQYGNGNTLNVTQDGDKNTANINQGIRDYSNSLFSPADDNTATITQKGNENEIEKLEVTGANNRTDVYQEGDKNYFGDQYGLINGENNIVTVHQQGVENKTYRVKIDGQNSNEIRIRQVGNINAVNGNNSNGIIDVRGDNNKLDVTQYSDNNTVDQVWLKGDYNNVTFKQVGNENKISGDNVNDWSSEIKGNDNVITVEQVGNNNQIVNGVDVYGSDNVVSLKQDGDNNELKLVNTEIEGSPLFEENTVLVDQIGHENKMTANVRGQFNTIKLRLETNSSTATITQNGNSNKIYAFDQQSKAVFKGQELIIDQQGDENEVKMNTERAKVKVLQNGNDYAEVDNHGTANIFIDQQADHNFARIKGAGNGQANFVQKGGAENDIKLKFECDLGEDEVNITQDGTANTVKGVGNSFASFCGSDLNITQTGEANTANICGNGSISVTQAGNSNEASITQSAN